MKAGIPKEITTEESRVGAAPKTVKRLLKQGFEVLIESGAGLSANFSDEAYEGAGATIISDAAALYSESDIILKVQPVTDDEIDLMQKGQVCMSYLYPRNNVERLEKLASKGVNAIAMDAIPRISRAQKMDVLSSMANIAGYRSVIEGANHFGRFLNGQITAAGKVEPAKVLVIGAGVAGLRESRQLEILVQLFNNRLLDAMRERAGASYAPVVRSEWPSDAPSGGRITAFAQLQPRDVPIFFQEADRIADDLVANPPSADELERVTEPLRQYISRASTGNLFWLFQLEGATTDARLITYLRPLLSDYSRTTPEIMQMLAKRYFGSRDGFRLAVIPEGQQLATTIPEGVVSGR